MSWDDLTKGPRGGADWRWAGVAIVLTVAISSAVLSSEAGSRGVAILLALAGTMIAFDILVRRRRS
jgi:hypothetical protein